MECISETEKSWSSLGSSLRNDNEIRNGEEEMNSVGRANLITITSFSFD